MSAKDKGTGKEQKITITSSSGLSEEEIEKMVQDAKEHEAEDKKAKDAVEKRNRLDGMIMELEKTIKENKDKLEESEVKTTQDALEKAKAALKEHENNAEELQKATDELMQSSHKVAEKLYKEKAAQEQAQQTPETESAEKKEGSDEPIDAEINE